MIQRQALAIILGKEGRSYRKNLAKLELETLAERRELLTKKFAVRTYVSYRHSNQCFVQNPKFSAKTRTSQPRVLLPNMVTERGDGAPYSHMGKILNEMSLEEFELISKGVPPPPPSPSPQH